MDKQRVTVLETIQRGTEFLAGKGVESPRLHAEWLVAHALGVPRLQLYLQFDRVLDDGETARARELVQRRGRREPLQHLVGSWGFCGLEIQVGPEALIPRPETEVLAETVLSAMSATEAGLALDFGTGSGCLAVTLAVRRKGLICHALDLSVEALALAQSNARRHGVADRVVLHSGDGFGALPAGLRFRWIVSNPPYIPTGELELLQIEVRDHDPRLALDGGEDGLAFYRRLAAEGGVWLEPGGSIFLELGDGQAPLVSELFREHNWIVGEVAADYSGRPRVFTARWEEVKR